MFETFGIKPEKKPEPMVVVVEEPKQEQKPKEEPKPVERVKPVDVESKLFGKDLFGVAMTPASGGPLAKRFGVPPFSVLNAREGDWQERKRAWISLGIKGEVGRGGNGTINGSEHISGIDYYSKKEKEKFGVIGGTSLLPAFKLGADDAKLKYDGKLHNGPTIDAKNGDEYDGGRSCWQNANTSVFDPVLCELMFKWFCPVGGQVLDPFGGESTKGIVATVLGYNYTAIEVRQEQVDANYHQAKEVGVNPQWICGDSSQASKLLPEGLKADLIFTSPPYFNLEIYSDDEADGSAFEDYGKFMVWYKEIFRQFVERLKPNRFLVVKVGEIRDKETGVYRNFVGDNISCFLDLGLQYYNEMILVTAAGSLPIRAGKQFASGRKIGKTHQNLLVFYKGNPKKIKEEFGNTDCAS